MSDFLGGGSAAEIRGSQSSIHFLYLPAIYSSISYYCPKNIMSYTAEKFDDW